MNEYRIEIDHSGITLTQCVEIDLPETVGNLEPLVRDNLIIEAAQWIETALGVRDLAKRADNARVYLLLDDDTEIELKEQGEL